MKIKYLGDLAEWATVIYLAWLSIMDHKSRASSNLRHNALGLRCRKAMKDEHGSGLLKSELNTKQPNDTHYCQHQDNNRIYPLCNNVFYITYHILVSAYINKWCGFIKLNINGPDHLRSLSRVIIDHGYGMTVRLLLILNMYHKIF